MTLVPQIGMAELLLLMILAVVVVGPRDLPKLMRTVGQGMAKVRRLADEFRVGFDQMAREAEIDDMRKEIEALKSANPAREVGDALNDVRDAAEMEPLQPPAKPAPSSAD